MTPSLRRDGHHGGERCVCDQPLSDALTHHVLGDLDGGPHVGALGQLGGDRGSEGATGTAHPLLTDLGGTQDGDVLTVEVHVHDVRAGQYGPPLDDHV